jgi:hypothetical protein
MVPGSESNRHGKNLGRRFDEFPAYMGCITENDYFGCYGYVYSAINAKQVLPGHLEIDDTLLYLLKS